MRVRGPRSGLGTCCRPRHAHALRQRRHPLRLTGGRGRLLHRSHLPRDLAPSLAATRAGSPLEGAVYFGDAPWDVIVSRRLGIRMIGIGRRHEKLRELGVPHVFRDYTDPDAILAVLSEAATH